MYHNIGDKISIQNFKRLLAVFVMNREVIIRFTPFNLHSRRNNYRKEMLLMTVYKIAKITFPKRASQVTALQKKAQYLGLKKLVKPQINHNKTEKHNIAPNHQKQDTIENVRLFPNHASIS